MESDNESNTGVLEVVERRNPSRKARNSLHGPLQPDVLRCAKTSSVGWSALNIGSDDEKDVKAPVEKPVTPQKPVKAAKKGRKGKGRATADKAQADDLLTNLPFDILFAVCGNLKPKDLLSLARTSKSLRKIFMSKNAERLWQASTSALPADFPLCPPDLSIPAHVALFFDDKKNCQLCGKGHEASLVVHYYLRVVLCYDCEKKNVIYEGDLERVLGKDAEEMVMDLVHYDRKNARCGYDNRQRKSWVREGESGKRPRRFYVPELKVWHKKLLRDEEGLEERHAMMRALATEVEQERQHYDYHYDGAIHAYNQRHYAFLRKEQQRKQEEEELKIKVFIDQTRTEMVAAGHDDVTDEAILAVYRREQRQLELQDAGAVDDETAKPDANRSTEVTLTFDDIARQQDVMQETDLLKDLDNDMDDFAHDQGLRCAAAMDAIRKWLSDNWPEDSPHPSLLTLVHISDFLPLVMGSAAARATALSQAECDEALEGFEVVVKDWMKRIKMRLASPPLGTYRGDLDDEDAVDRFLSQATTCWSFKKGRSVYRGWPAILEYGSDHTFDPFYNQLSNFNLAEWEHAFPEGALIRRMLSEAGLFTEQESDSKTFDDLMDLRFVVATDVGKLVRLTGIFDLLLKPLPKWHRLRQAPEMPRMTVYSKADEEADDKARRRLRQREAVWQCVDGDCGVTKEDKMTMEEAIAHAEAHHPRAYKKYLKGVENDLFKYLPENLDDLGYTFANYDWLQEHVVERRRRRMADRLGLTIEGEDSEVEEEADDDTGSVQVKKEDEPAQMEVDGKEATAGEVEVETEEQDEGNQVPDAGGEPQEEDEE